MSTSSPQPDEPRDDEGKPAGPGEPEEPRSAPRYGQYAPGPQPPQSGQQAPPQYGQYGPPPQYGQYGQPPQYGQYGQPPQYGQYGQPPQYSQQYGQPPYGQQGGYNTYWTPPQEAQQKAVMLAFWLVIATAVLEVVLAIVGILAVSNTAALRSLFDQFNEQAGTTTRTLTFQEFQSLIVTVMWVLFAGAVVNAALLVVSAIFVRRGRRWARILGTVVLALTIFSFFNAGVLALITVALAIASIVMLFRPGVTAFLNAHNTFANPYSGPPRSFGNPYGQ
jgi:hypothetical protein